MENSDLTAILGIITKTGGLAELAPDQDFYDAGFTSVMALPLLMDLEDNFGVTIPDQDFISARTASALQALIADIRTRN